MNAELQSRCWACLPKEAREEIRAEYQNAIEGSDLEDFLIDIFGHHNLTSDTEPKEMLTKPRTEVQEYFYEINRTIDKTTNHDVRMQSIGKQTALKALFGDKYLPDKEYERMALKIDCADDLQEMFKDEFSDKELEHRLEQTSVQVEPKFKAGDKVKEKGTDRILTISDTFWNIRNDYQYAQFVETGDMIKLSDLEPYTEPETKVPDNRQALYDALCELESASAKVRKSLISLQ